MAELASLQGEIPSTYDQLVRQLQCARLTADQLGDPVVTMLLDLVQRRCLTRSPAAGSPRRELATPGTLAPPDSLTVYLFGSFQSFLNGVALNGWHKKGGALFKYLVMHRAVPVHRDKLIDLFWPDADLVAARNCLNVTLHALRRSLQAVSGEHGARANTFQISARAT